MVMRDSNGVGIRTAWRPLNEATMADIPVSLGVYEIADSDRHILELGYAGGRSTFGLRGEIRQRAAQLEGHLLYRIEETSAYLSRHKELVDLLHDGAKE